MPDPTTQPADAAPPPSDQATTPPAPDDSTGTNGGTQGEEKRFTQAELNAAITERLERARKSAETAAQKARDEAAAQHLKEQAEWEKLATQHEATVKELGPQVETLTAERDRLVEIVTAVIAAETKDWAKEVKELLPADAGVLETYAAVERTRALAAKLAQTAPAQGNGPSPKPAGNAQGTDQAARDRMAAFTRSRF